MRSSRPRSAVVIGILAAMLAAWTPGQSCEDAVQLTDGRFVTGIPMTRSPEGVKIHYQNGDVLVPKTLVLDASTSKVEGTEASQPTPEEQERLAKGEVRFEGAWMKKERRDQILAKRAEVRRKRIAEARDHREWRNRYTKETKNFSFEYTIDPVKMDEYADLMETYFKVFTQQWKITKPSGFGRLKVCFYHDEEYFHQVSGAPGGVIGYFRFVPPEELHFYYDRSDERMTVDVMFHETNHFLTHLIDPKFAYPPWVNESLAEYYGASEWDPKKKQMQIGNIQAGRLTVIQDQIAGGDWQKLEPLIRLQHGEFNAIHYAWGWSFVHYLLETPKYAENFKKFYIALAREKSIDRKPFNFDMKTVDADAQIAALIKYLKVPSLAVLEKEWHEYIKGLEQSSARGWAEAGSMLLSRDMPIKAKRYFETAIDKGWKTPTTYYGLGRALVQKGLYQEAAQAFENAIGGDPLDAGYYISLARCRRQIAKDPEDPESLRLRKLAAEIDPDDFDVLMDGLDIKKLTGDPGN